MTRRLLRKLGATKATLAIAAVSILFSVVLNLVISYILEYISVMGIVMSIIIPAVVAPLVSYFVVRVLIHLDIAEEALRTSEEKYRLVVENANQGIVVVQDGIPKFVNPKIVETSGYSTDELTSRSFIEFIHPDDRALVAERHQKRSKGEKLPDTYPFRIIDKDGNTRWIEINSVRIDWDGRPATLNFLTDITERKRAEAEIKKLSSAVEQSIDGIAMTDPGLRLVYVNEAFAKMHNYSVKQMVGMKTAKLHSDDQMEEFKASLDQVNKQGSWTGQIEHIKGDGTPFPTYTSLTLLKTTEGQPAGLLTVTRDITEQRKLEAQFLWSQRMEAVGHLAGGIAHDFNNMLTTIKGYADLRLMELDPANSLHADLCEIQKASERAAKLTHQLLAFSRNQILEPKVANLNDVLLETDKMLRPLIGEDIELVTLLAEDLANVKTDLSQIEQVLVNLAVNARDAMPNGGKLTLETANITVKKEYARNHVTVTPGKYVMLAVSDTGVGMTEEVRQHIFEPFFTTKEVGKGTGLGLATCYGIVKQCGGNMWVYSEPGKGATFKIYLPEVDHEAEALPKRDEAELLPRGKENLLLVEDELSVRRVAARVLRALGYTVLEAENGDDALRVASENHAEIHLLLTDVVMPQLGGKPLAERIISHRPETKILFFSGYAGSTIAPHGILDAGLAFLQKPFSPARLACKVREVLDAPRNRGENPGRFVQR
jgi:PAS domain S-box-containing protein